ncbi:uncharacterized protein LOC120737319 isoform X3 [Simochromis diagramma]|uniref:uncharacterized protein LOC120737319 isoform X3 n=1 Tax=Simochromis diagramma TaxID=43689 RepID=UPI001A7F0D5C|nr:uncharacterized protein LOC120737319 isoform X3 [Simochromis diagramma]
MKVCHTFITFIFLTALQDGNTGVVGAVIPIRTGMEGGTITVGCSFTLSGSRKLFFVYVSITELEKSDSGRYRCSLDRTPSDHLSLNWDFEVVVTEASTFKTKSHVKPISSSAHLPSSPRPLTWSFTSGSTLPLSAFSESTKQPKTSPASSGILLPVVIIVVLAVFLLPVVLLLIYKKRAVHSNDLNRRSSDHNQTEVTYLCLFSLWFFMMTLLQPPNVKAELTLLLVQPQGQGLNLSHTHGGTITHTILSADGP